MVIDTMHIELHDCSTLDVQERMAMVDSVTGEVQYEKGYKGCIKVRKNGGKIRIECSLPKLLRGNNIYMLSYSEVVEAIKKIEQELNIPISRGIIRRIDTFVNIQTNNTPMSYFRYLGDCRYLKRGLIGNTSLYYKNGNRELVFYDKIQEMNAKKVKLPLSYNDTKHLLRIEYKLRNKAIQKSFNGNLYVEQLYNKETGIKLIEHLYQAYTIIFKEVKPSFNVNILDSQKGFIKQLANIGIETLGGVNSVCEMIDDTKQRYLDLRPEYVSRRKKETKSIASLDGIAQNNKSIEELDSKVKELCHRLILGIETP